MRNSPFMIFFLVFGLIAALSGCKTRSTGSTTISTVNPVVYSPEQAEKIARIFSISYRPDSLPYEGIGKLEKVPDSIVTAFTTLRQANSEAHNKWLTLLFLKLYLDHLRCCHQGYELRNNPVGAIDSTSDPLLYEFALSTKLVDVTERAEFLNSDIGDRWLLKNPSLSLDPEIKEILTAMEPVKDSIAKGLYW